MKALAGGFPLIRGRLEASHNSTTTTLGWLGGLAPTPIIVRWASSAFMFKDDPWPELLEAAFRDTRDRCHTACASATAHAVDTHR